MVRIFKTIHPIYPFILLMTFLLSCEKDSELLSDHVMEDGPVAVLDDNYRIPDHITSVLDVLSNDNYIASGNTRIVEATPPSHGKIRINEDNTITYIPENVEMKEGIVAHATDETTSPDRNATETDIGVGQSKDAPTEELAAVNQAVNQTATETDPDETLSEEDASQASGPEETVPEDKPEEIASQETSLEEPAPEANTPQENESGVTTSKETVTDDTSTEDDSTSENDASENGKTNTEDNPSYSEESTSEIDLEESPSIVEAPTDETTAEDNPIEEIQEDSFTYTTETEDEDGSVITETATVTVEVESATAAHAEASPETNTSSETDYWRDPVIAGTRFLDEMYFDLDTGEIYPKEVSLQRGQVENYIEHENCPQRIKDKWDNRIEVSPSDVNGSQNGLQAIFDAHPRGSLFYLKAGVYQDQKNAVLKNDQDVVGAYGAILDGSGISGNSEESTRAIRSMERGYICNLKVREYPTWNDPQNPRNPRGAALEVIQNGAILNCEVHSHNKAIALIYGSKAMWNKFTAGRLGIYGYGSHDPNSPNRRGMVVKYNEWYDCNFNGYDGEHEAGGSKVVQTDGTLWSHNYIHDISSGGGIWLDGDNRDAEIYNNVIVKTHRAIFSEASHTSNMHHNTIEYGTGFGAIYMANAQGEKAHHNFIRWCRNGITIRDKPRGTSKIYPGKVWRGINNEIHDNHIWQRPDPSTWTHGMITLFDGHIDPNNTTNKWRDNHYYVDDNAGGAALFSEDKPFTLVFMYSKLAPDSDHKTISWDFWKNQSGDKNSTLEYQKFF